MMNNSHNQWPVSRFHSSLPWLFYLVVAGALFSSILPWTIKLFASLMMMWQLTRWQRHWIIALFADGQEPGAFTLTLADGRYVAVRVNRIYCLAWIQFVSFRCWRGHCYSLLVLPSSADAGKRRHWRRFLRYGMQTSTRLSTR